MKLTCTQRDLAHALSTVNHAASRRTTLPILANILFTAEGNTLTLTASNGEGMTIACRINANITEPGRAALPAKRFSDYIGSLSSPEVALTIQDGSFACHIKCGRSQADINGMDPSEFPVVPSIAEGVFPIVMDATLLKEVVGQVAFAAADDESRPILATVRLAIEDEALTFVAADTCALAVRKIAVLDDLSGELLVPARAMEQLAQVLPMEGAVEMRVTSRRNQILFHTRDVDFFAVLLEGTYANYKAAIPKAYATRAVVDRQAFAAAVKEMIPFARDGGNIVRMTLRGKRCQDGEPNTVTLEARAEELGNNVSVIDAAISGEDQQEVLLNVKYLTAGLAVLDVPAIAVEVVGPIRPVVIKPLGPMTYHYIIMPLSDRNRAAVPPQPESTSSQTREPVPAAY